MFTCIASDRLFSSNPLPQAHCKLFQVADDVLRNLVWPLLDDDSLDALNRTSRMVHREFSLSGRRLKRHAERTPEALLRFAMSEYGCVGMWQQPEPRSLLLCQEMAWLNPLRYFQTVRHPVLEKVRTVRIKIRRWYLPGNSPMTGCNWFEDLPRQLTTLFIASSSVWEPCDLRVGVDAIATLPSSLTHLRLPPYTLRWSHLWHLPPTLLVLDAMIGHDCLEKWNEDDGRAPLPPNLQRLRTYDLTSFRFPLPASLFHIDVQVMNGCDGRLPSTVRVLKVDTLFVSANRVTIGIIYDTLLPLLPASMDFLIANKVALRDLDDEESEPIPVPLIALESKALALQRYPEYAAHHDAFDV
jgi:hypothetical protein